MKIKKRDGFTLIEIVVALAAFMIIMLTITSILMSVIKYSSMNSRDFNLGKISQVIFETAKEKKPTLSKSDNSNKFEGGFNVCIDNETDLRTFVRDKIFVNSGTFANPDNFSACNTDSSKKYAVGIKIEWVDEGTVLLPPPAVTGEKLYIGTYKVDVYCWDIEKGESSLVHRLTRISIN